MGRGEAGAYARGGSSSALWAVFAVDPGGVSGVGRFVGPLGDDVASTFAGGVWETWEAEGTVLEQSLEIAGEFLDWYGSLRLAGVAETRIRFVFESFELRQRSVDLSPVRVTSMVYALLWRLWEGSGSGGVGMEFQSPGDAKAFATSARLRSWGLWVVGSDHRRDAARHLALAVSKAIG